MNAQNEPHPKDRLVAVVLLLVVVVTVGTLIVALVTLPAILDSKAGIDAQRRSDQITGCRGVYRSAIDAAANVKDAAESRRIDAISDIVLGSIAKDPVKVVEASDRLAKSKIEVAVAREKVELATRANEAAVKLSSTDPAAFLRDCRRLIT